MTVSVDRPAADLDVNPMAPAQPAFAADVRFAWQPNTDAVAYEIYGLNNNPQALVDSSGRFSIGPVEANEATLLNLPAGDWTWWIRAVDATGLSGRWSSATSLNNTGRLSLTSVSVSSNGLAMFDWQRVTGAVRYVLHVDNLTTGDRGVIREDLLNSETFTAASSLTAGSYRAWVRAVSGDNVVGAWSRQFDFVVG